MTEPSSILAGNTISAENVISAGNATLLSGQAPSVAAFPAVGVSTEGQPLAEEASLRHNPQTHGLVPDFWGSRPKVNAGKGPATDWPLDDARGAVRLSGLCSAMVFAWWSGWLWFHEPTATVWRWLAMPGAVLPTAALAFTLTITPMVTACWIFILCNRAGRAGWPAWLVAPYFALVVAPLCWLWHLLFPSNEMLALVACTVPLEMFKPNSFVIVKVARWFARLHS